MDIKTQVQNLSQIRDLPVGAQLFQFGDPCNHYVLVLEGQVRVELASITGQQLVLYRIYTGQPCVLTTACLMSGNNYSAQAFTESQVQIALLSEPDFSSMLAESADFRQFVFDGFSERLSIMMQRTSELATYTIEQRLAAALLARCEWRDDPMLEVTHDRLAVEIGTAREVVSRRLAVLESDGIIKRHRKYLEILNIDRLKQRLAYE